MNDLKEILIDIKEALLEIKNELERQNDLKEVELKLQSDLKYKTEKNIKKLQREQKYE